MAMARLCANLTNDGYIEENIRRVKFIAFIVDHGARPNSQKEATWVKHQLISWGIPVNWAPIDCQLTQARTKSHDFEREMASRSGFTTIIEF